MRLTETGEGVRIDARRYSVILPTGSPTARLSDSDGRVWTEVALLAQVDSTAGLDDTAAVGRHSPAVGENGWELTIELTSSVWRRKEVRLRGDEESIRFSARVEGDGELTDVRLLGGACSADPRRGPGTLLSRSPFRTLFTPQPADPARVCRDAAEPASIDVSGDAAMPGRAHWLFTPPPFWFALSPCPSPAPSAGEDAARAFLPDDVVREEPAIPDGPWLGAGIAAAIETQTFTTFRYEPAERAFSFVLRYEGQTAVRGAFETPALVLRFGDADPYSALAAYSAELRRDGLAPTAPAARRWWLEPIFCGWGAQSRLGRRLGLAPPLLSREEHYDRWLGRLAAEGVVPGTVVLDDKWQAAYGTCMPDVERWPDLPGWIGRRHAAGQRVLLWWKAWDPEGVPAEHCVRNTAGRAVATDPTNPAYEALLRESIRRMLGPRPEGYDADGLKVDFTARTPSGPGLRREGRAWGASLLHRLLAIVADEARRTKPDALIVTHTPNPSFADVSGMLRLNDMQRLDEPDDRRALVAQMVHRARVARAACPTLAVDTDDWCVPDLATWRAYLRRKADLGVPALYYVEGLEAPGQDFEAADYAALREVWAAWRRGIARQALPEDRAMNEPACPA